MTGPRPNLDHADLIVVFDNNAYGDLVEGKTAAELDSAVAELVQLERRNRIQAFVNPYVLLDLLRITKQISRPQGDRPDKIRTTERRENKRRATLS